MPRITPPNRTLATIALLVVPLACLGLGACGGSSSKPSSSAAATTATHSTAETTPATTTASTTPTSTTPTTTAPPSNEPTIKTAHQFALVYECLRHSGIALPPLKSVKSIGELKVNTSTPQYRSTLAKCRHEVLG
jgi:hypothetical protein